MPFYIYDGVDDCVRAVRLIRRRGTRFIEVATGGTVASPGPPQAQEFSLNELCAIVREADRWDMAVTAHYHGVRGVEAALEAGYTTLEQ